MISAFGALGARLGYSLRRLDLLAMESAGNDLAEIGLTPARASALFYIAMNEGCDQASLGKALGVKRASTLEMVNALVQVGAIERRPRTNALHLTVRGIALSHEVESVTATHDTHFFGCLSASERAAFAATMHKILANNAGDIGRDRSANQLRRVK